MGSGMYEVSISLQVIAQTTVFSIHHAIYNSRITSYFIHMQLCISDFL